MTEEVPKVGSDKTLRWMIWIIVVLVVLVGGYLIYRWAMHRGVEERYAAIRAAGEPVTLEELDEWYPTPPVGQNGADVYQQAFLKFSSPKELDYENLPIFGGGQLPEFGEPISAKMLPVIREYLAANEEALKLLHEAAAYEECRYPINTRDGLAMRMPHLEQLRHAYLLLELQTILKTEDGDAEGVAEAIQDSLALGLSLKNEPLFWSHLMQMQCYSSACASLRRVLDRIELSDVQLVELMNSFKNAETPEAVTRALVGDRCTAIAAFNDPTMLDGTGGASRSEILLLQFAGLLDLDAKEYMDIMSDYVAAAEAPISERSKLLEEVETRIENIPRYCMHSRVLTVANSAFITRAVESVAYLRCAATAVAVERYGLAKGELPAQLSDITPEFISEIPADPFTGAALLYKLTDTGYIIYSVGENGEDDGGVRKRIDTVNHQPIMRHELDVPFEVVHPVR